MSKENHTVWFNNTISPRFIFVHVGRDYSKWTRKTYTCTCRSEWLEWYFWSNHTVPMKIYVFYLFTRTIALFSLEIDTVLYVVDGVSDGIICYGKNIRTIKLRFAQHSSDSVATTLHIHAPPLCYLEFDGETLLFPYIKKTSMTQGWLGS